jgi:hypothetical protein
VFRAESEFLFGSEPSINSPFFEGRDEFVMRNKAMHRKELSRIYELCDLLPNPLPPGAYFRDFDKNLTESPHDGVMTLVNCIARVRRKQFRDIESDLQGLDAAAWTYLKAEVAPLLTAKHETRGWQPLFDKLNQVKAFNYLIRIGCSDVRFIPESSAKGQQTPDLGALAGRQKVLCEVKTINISEIEACRRHSQGVGTSTDQLPDGFFRKLASDLTQAKKQMLAYDPDSATRKLAYVIANFDDLLHEYADRYQVQIDQFMAGNAVPQLEVFFDIEPAFYAAQSG